MVTVAWSRTVPEVFACTKAHDTLPDVSDSSETVIEIEDDDVKPAPRPATSEVAPDQSKTKTQGATCSTVAVVRLPLGRNKVVTLPLSPGQVRNCGMMVLADLAPELQAVLEKQMGEDEREVAPRTEFEMPVPPHNSQSAPENLQCDTECTRPHSQPHWPAVEELELGERKLGYTVHEELAGPYTSQQDVPANRYLGHEFALVSNNDTGGWTDSQVEDAGSNTGLGSSTDVFDTIPMDTEAMLAE